MGRLIYCGIIMVVAFWGNPVTARSAEDLYRSYCATCHGKSGTGGMGPSLVDEQWKYPNTDDKISEIITQGLSQAGMPAFGKMLSGADTRALVIYLRELAYEQRHANDSSEAKDDHIFTALGHSFSLKPVAELDGTVWGVDFYGKSQLIVTSREGKLWLIGDNGSVTEVGGVPKVLDKGQGGLLDVQVLNNTNPPWVYLSFSHAQGTKSMTSVVRGKIKQGRFVDEQTIYQADAKDYTTRHHHYGSRLLLVDDYLYFTVGDRGEQVEAQKLINPKGKIHRLHLDGKLPQDNPFVGSQSAQPSIWSYGHRNPQGIALHPVSGAVWAAEHGPRGGDEINLIRKGANYGWPEITFGMNYDGSPITSKTHAPKMLQPEHYWVPSIAVSDIHFYSGALFPNWQNQLLVSSLAKQELRLVQFDNAGKVIADHVLFAGLGRIRDVAVNNAGEPYVLMNQQGRGLVYRLVPKT